MRKIRELLRLRLEAGLSIRQISASTKTSVGPTVPIINPQTGEIRTAQVFVAVLGASNYTYAEATWSQALQDWLMSHVRTFEFFGGVPEMLIPDNLRSGVSKACRYDPDLNPSYQQLAGALSGRGAACAALQAQG